MTFENNKTAHSERYQRLGRCIIKGSFKQVYEGFDKRTQKDVAWNEVDISSVRSEKKLENIRKETEVLKSLSHRNILRFHDTWLNKEQNRLIFITDTVRDGSLQQYIKDRDITIGRVKEYCVQILSALAYLHKGVGSPPKPIIHRDLKCENIFIDALMNRLVIANFCNCTSITSMDRVAGQSVVGSPQFMAPELYEEKYNEKVDIFAFGMTVLQMVTKKFPYQECATAHQIWKKVTRKEMPAVFYTIVPKAVREFIAECAQFDWKLRPSAKQLLAHPFLNQPSTNDNLSCSDELVVNPTLSAPKPAVTREASKDSEEVNISPMAVVPSPTDIMEAELLKAVKNEETGNFKISLKVTCEMKPHPHRPSSMAVKNVTFDYKPGEDTPQSVAKEMVHDLGLVPKDVMTKTIEEALSESSIKDKLPTTSLTTEHSLSEPTLVVPKTRASMVLPQERASIETGKIRREDLIKQLRPPSVRRCRMNSAPDNLPLPAKIYEKHGRMNSAPLTESWRNHGSRRAYNRIGTEDRGITVAPINLQWSDSYDSSSSKDSIVLAPSHQGHPEDITAPAPPLVTLRLLTLGSFEGDMDNVSSSAESVSPDALAVEISERKKSTISTLSDAEQTKHRSSMSPIVMQTELPTLTSITVANRPLTQEQTVVIYSAPVEDQGASRTVSNESSSANNDGDYVTKPRGRPKNAGVVNHRSAFGEYSTRRPSEKQLGAEWPEFPEKPVKTRVDLISTNITQKKKVKRTRSSRPLTKSRGRYLGLCAKRSVSCFELAKTYPTKRTNGQDSHPHSRVQVNAKSGLAYDDHFPAEVQNHLSAINSKLADNRRNVMDQFRERLDEIGEHMELWCTNASYKLTTPDRKDELVNYLQEFREQVNRMKQESKNFEDSIALDISFPVSVAAGGVCPFSRQKDRESSQFSK